MLEIKVIQEEKLSLFKRRKIQRFTITDKSCIVFSISDNEAFRQYLEMKDQINEHFKSIFKSGGSNKVLVLPSYVNITSIIEDERKEKGKANETK